MGAGAAEVARALALLVLIGLAACATEDRPRQAPPRHTGPFEAYWPDGTLRERGAWTRGVRDGDFESFHRNGARATEGGFEAGLPVGAHRAWNDDGRLVREARYAAGVEDGRITEWYDDGQVRLTGTWAAGKRHGVETSYHPNGIVAVEGRYEHGLPVGGWTFRDEQTRVRREVLHWVEDGRRAGMLETHYDEQGRITSQSQRDREGGRWSGVDSTWHAEGQQATLVELRDGRRHGREQAWDEHGVLRLDGRWREDAKVGTWRVYGPDGVAERTILYEDGVAVPP